MSGRIGALMLQMKEGSRSADRGAGGRWRGRVGGAEDWTQRHSFDADFEHTLARGPVVVAAIGAAMFQPRTSSSRNRTQGITGWRKRPNGVPTLEQMETHPGLGT